MTELVRTHEEIAQRIKDVKNEGGDFFGFANEVYVMCLPAAEGIALGVYREDLTPKEIEDSDESLWKTQEDVEREADAYLVFAFGKALDHRGLSAGRSIDKMRAFAWLLKRDDVIEAMDAASYQNYGVPKLFAYAKALDKMYLMPSDPFECNELVAMGQGRQCRPGCKNGCSA